MLSFLDVHVSIVNGDFQKSVFRKKSNTDVVLNDAAMCPTQWKVDLVRCFLHRAWKVCSSYTSFDLEIQKLRSIFYRNGYSVQFFNEIVKKFLCNLYEPKVQPRDPDKCIDDIERFYVLKIPYIGNASVTLKQKLKDLVKEWYKFCLLYTSPSPRDS